ncbi:MAG: mannonate dehydratase [Sphingobacteriaceae bacterium]
MNHPSINFDELPIRIGFGSFSQPTDDRLRFIKQVGVDDILMNFYRSSLIDTAHQEQPLNGDGEWSYNELLALRNRVEDYGLRLNAIENLPRDFYRDVMLGKPNRDRQIEKIQRTLENIARVGIPIFGYDWDPTDVLRSSVSYKLRGGAESMSINLKDYENAPLFLDRVYSENEMWEYYHYFLEHIIPVVESVGLKIALHPTDPPVPSLGGVPRLFRSREAFDKAFSLVPSENHGCEFCLGNWAAMGEDILDVIEHYGKQNKLFYVHFQTISNSLPEKGALHEVFVDMPGYYDPIEVMQKLREVGFNGLIIPGHVPRIIGDGQWCERSRGMTAGYLKGILRTLEQVKPI